MTGIPQRRHRVWDLLWRLPNDEVPFAVEVVRPFCSSSDSRFWGIHTHRCKSRVDQSQLALDVNLKLLTSRVTVLVVEAVWSIEGEWWAD